MNRLVRSDPDVRSRLDALAADLRAAAGSADGARIRELTAARARLVDELTRAALRVSELPAPPAALREEVTATLDAAIADPEVAARLVRELHLGLGACGRRDAPPGAARSDRYSSRALLPTPASPRSTTTRLWPASASRSRPSSAAHSPARPSSRDPSA